MNNQLISMPHIGSVNLDGEVVQAVCARHLYDFLEIKTPFNDWINRRISEYLFSEGKDFYSFLGESSGGRPRREYTVSLDMAKELSMVERNEKGREARRYFIECERIAKESKGQNCQISTTPSNQQGHGLTQWRKNRNTSLHTRKQSQLLNLWISMWISPT